jgi:cyclopropane-fatty-acyl-phospholipid synthase
MENQHPSLYAETAVMRGNHRVYHAILDRILAPMKAGRLQIILPSGEEVNYGLGEPGPEAAIRIRNPDFFKKCILYGDVGFGESYVDGDWETDDVVQVISWFVYNIESAPTVSGSQRRFSFTNLLQIFNRLQHKARANSVTGSRRNIADHYDLSNDFFRLFLDRSMTYSCAWFAAPEMELEAAQIEKYDRLCRKLKLTTSDEVLEIGGGWGGFAVHAARKYGCKITSITVSEEQLKYARERIAAAGLSDRIDFQLTDYRNIRGKFAKIVSIEMLEAVGHQYLNAYFRQCHELLKKDGLLALQVITCPDARYDQYRKGSDWLQKHIFPGGALPSIGALNRALNQTGDLHLHHLEEMGLHYARTLALWRENFNRQVEAVRAQGFDERFIRKWRYYLTYCEAAFRLRNITVVQAVFTRPNNLTLTI